MENNDLVAVYNINDSQLMNYSPDKMAIIIVNSLIKAKETRDKINDLKKPGFLRKVKLLFSNYKLLDIIDDQQSQIEMLNEIINRILDLNVRNRIYLQKLAVKLNELAKQKNVIHTPSYTMIYKQIKSASKSFYTQPYFILIISVIILISLYYILKYYQFL